MKDEDIPWGMTTGEVLPLNEVQSPAVDLNNSPEPIRVPLVVYVGDIRRIVGDAVVSGDQIEAFIDPVKGRELARAIEEGVIDNVSVTFNPAPAVPTLGENGHVEWRKV